MVAARCSAMACQVVVFCAAVVFCADAGADFWAAVFCVDCSPAWLVKQNERARKAAKRRRVRAERHAMRNPLS